MRLLITVSSVDLDGGSIRIVVAGDLDIEECRLVSDRVAGELTNSTIREVVMDLAGVDYLGARGVRMLQEIADRLADRGGRLTIETMTPIVRRVVEVCGSAERLGVIDDLAPIEPARVAERAVPPGTEGHGRCSTAARQ